MEMRLEVEEQDKGYTGQKEWVIWYSFPPSEENHWTKEGDRQIYLPASVKSFNKELKKTLL